MSPPKASASWPVTAAALVFMALAYWFFHRMVFFYPQGIHEWAQADRLALALQYYDQGLHFFRPATFNISSLGGITGVEFPLPAYLAAWAGKIVGRGHISLCFRLINTLVVLTGLVFLFQLVYYQTRHFLLALLPGVFLLGSPVYAFYTCNYLPDAVSAAFLWMALFYFFRFYQTRRFADAIRCLTWLILATLLKLSAGIYLVALGMLLGREVYRQPGIFQPRQRAAFISVLATGLVLIVGYILYNRYLNQTYGAQVFLAHAMPVDSWDTFTYIRFRIATIWRYEYFTSLQYFLLGACLLGCGWGFTHRGNIPRNFMALLILSLLGCGAFFWLMGKQFIDHDYYFITTGLPLAVLLVLLAVLQLPQMVANRYYLNSTLILLLLGLAFSGYRQLQARNKEPYKDFSNYYTYHWMVGGARALDQAGIPRDAKLLVLNSAPPNLALIYFDRRGIVRQTDNGEEIAGWLREYDLQYVLLAAKEFEVLRAKNPDAAGHFQTIIHNEKWVLLQPQPASKPEK